MSKFICTVCDEEIPCILIIEENNTMLEHATLPKNCPISQDNNPEWKEVEDEK